MNQERFLNNSDPNPNSMGSSNVMGGALGSGGFGAAHTPPIPSQSFASPSQITPGSFAARSQQAHAAAAASSFVSPHQQHQQPQYITSPPPPQAPPPPPSTESSFMNNQTTSQMQMNTSIQQLQPQMHHTMNNMHQQQQRQQQPSLNQMHPPHSQHPPQPQLQGQAMGMPPQQQQQQQHQQQQQVRPMGMPAPAKAVNTYINPEMDPAQQQRMLNEATRKVQEHSHYMKEAMKLNNLSVVMDRAAHMVGELGGPPHGQSTNQQGQGQPAVGGPTNSGISPKLTPKNYYQLYLRALEDLPAFTDYLVQLSSDATTGAESDEVIRILPHAGATTTKYTLADLYGYVQYCPRVVSRLYLQIAAGQAWVEHGNGNILYILNDLQESIKCEQNPIRGLFLRHYLLTAFRDFLPDTAVVEKETIPVANPSAPTAEETVDTETADAEKEGAPDTPTAAPNDESPTEQVPATIDDRIGTVEDSYKFILANFMEMNKLWVRMQHMLGDRSKEIRRQRTKERNELRLLVGTNLVRLSQLEHVTSKIYGEVILSQILDHIVEVGEPLSQAYLMDCLVQVFPDEYHIETLPILLNVCPRLRDKVNIRTILQGLMDRLAKYLAEEELLDESDTNQVKLTLARDSFGMFEDCVQKVYNARGPKLTSKEVIRLQTALLQFSLKCYPGNMEQIGQCLSLCVSALRQANASYDSGDGTMATIIRPLDTASVAELEKLLSIPLKTFALNVLRLEHYNGLIQFLPWLGRRQLAVTMLEAVDKVGAPPSSMDEIEELFNVIEPVIRSDPSIGNGTSVDARHEDGLVSKLVHLLHDPDPNEHLEMLKVARTHLNLAGMPRIGQTLPSVIFAGCRLADKVASTAVAPSASRKEEDGELLVVHDATKDDATEEQPSTKEALSSSIQHALSPRYVYVFVQETLGMIAQASPDSALKLYLDVALASDKLVGTSSEMAPVAVELLNQAIVIYEDSITDSNAQRRCLRSIIGTLLSLSSFSEADYEALITKTTQFSAKLLKKPDQCELVALCSYLFFPSASGSSISYSNPQRSLECLQRSLKLADACTTTDPGCVGLFVDLMEHYLFFFENNNPLVGHAYITGLASLIRENFSSITDAPGVREAKAHFLDLTKYVKVKQTEDASSDLFQSIQLNA